MPLAPTWSSVTGPRSPATSKRRLPGGRERRPARREASVRELQFLGSILIPAERNRLLPVRRLRGRRPCGQPARRACHSSGSLSRSPRASRSRRKAIKRRAKLSADPTPTGVSNYKRRETTCLKRSLRTFGETWSDTSPYSSPSAAPATPRPAATSSSASRIPPAHRLSFPRPPPIWRVPSR